LVTNIHFFIISSSSNSLKHCVQNSLKKNSRIMTWKFLWKLPHDQLLECSQIQRQVLWAFLAKIMAKTVSRSLPAEETVIMWLTLTIKMSGMNDLVNYINNAWNIWGFTTWWNWKKILLRVTWLRKSLWIAVHQKYCQKSAKKTSTFFRKI